MPDLIPACSGGDVFDVMGAGYEPKGEFRLNGSEIKPSEDLKLLLTGATLASDAKLVQNDGRWHIKGDPTEGALVVAAAKAGLEKADLDKQFPRVNEIPFTSETKRMTTLHAEPTGTVAYAKGAAEVILDSCTRQSTADLLTDYFARNPSYEAAFAFLSMDYGIEPPVTGYDQCRPIIEEMLSVVLQGGDAQSQLDMAAELCNETLD